MRVEGLGEVKNVYSWL